MSRAFESSSAGLLPDDAVLECGVCWWVYDPAKGEDVWDTPPGTPFSALPDHWRCPSCDNAKSAFMRVEAGRSAPPPQPVQSLAQRVDSLVGAFEGAEANMLGLPVHNDRLGIEAVGFRDHDDGYVGIMITPWSMNIVRMPASADAPPAGPLGASVQHAFPSGVYSFLIGRMDGVGVIETCSLFSPMDEFDDPAVARATAEAAIEGLFEAEEPPPKQKPVSRRFILTMNGEAR